MNILKHNCQTAQHLAKMKTTSSVNLPWVSYYTAANRMALSRAHTSVKATDIAKLLLLNK